LITGTKDLSYNKKKPKLEANSLRGKGCKDLARGECVEKRGVLGEATGFSGGGNPGGGSQKQLLSSFTEDNMACSRFRSVREALTIVPQNAGAEGSCRTLATRNVKLARGGFDRNEKHRIPAVKSMKTRGAQGTRPEY